ncbi:hypothetical protein JHK87_025292 [Glycine soja]|nr:hypothetical protein JHK87_025292 [Glycine soja]
MARGKAKKKEEGEDTDVANPETLERKRLKSLAISNKILSETPARSSVHLNPSSVVAKHHGKDIIKKSQRKSCRYLFSFPGLIAPIAGGKIGDLKDLGTKNPVLYLDFPQGHQAEYDFKGGAGAGAASVVNQGVPRTNIQRVEQESPKTPTEDDLSDNEINLKDTKELVPVRHSTRTAKKSYKFAEISSGDDSGENGPELSDDEEKVVEVDTAIQKKTVVFDLDDEDDAPVDQPAKINTESASRSKSKEVSQSASASASTEVKSSNRGSLVQATISTLFKKVEEKVEDGDDDGDDIEEFSNASEDANESDEDWTA